MDNIILYFFFSFILLSKEYIIVSDLTKENIHGPVTEMIIKDYSAVYENEKLIKSNLLWKTQIKYNDYGNMTEYMSFLNGRTFYEKNIYEYNSNKFIVLIKHWAHPEIYGSKDTFIYNKENLLKEMIHLTPDNKILEKTIYDYDPSGFEISKTYNEVGLIKYKYQEKYNNKRQLLERFVFDIKKDSIANKYYFCYDSLENSIRCQNESLLNKDLNIYEGFDINRNWLIKKNYSSCNMITEREIKYMTNK